MKNHIYFIFGLSLILGCVEPFELDNSSYSKIIVIDASFSDVSKRHVVNINYSVPLDSTSAEKVKDAEVYILEDGSQRIEFSEFEEGVYLTDQNISAKEGSEYQLFVRLSDGTEYESEVEALPPKAEIDQVFGKFDEQVDENNNDVGGIQFFINASSTSGQAQFFRYKWHEDYQIKVPLPSAFEVEVVTFMGQEIRDFIRRVEDQEGLGICYGQGNSNSLLIADASDNINQRVSEFPVRFIIEGTEQLAILYALNVEQYSISRSTYDYYKRLKENNESSGSLFDLQKGFVAGNISAVLDPIEPVLGNFEVASFSEKREFFQEEDFSDTELESSSFLYDCSRDDLILAPEEEAKSIVRSNDAWRIYFFDFNTGQYQLVPRQCGSCSWRASEEKPEYWPF